MKRFLLVAGARPNFMKIAPLHAALAARGAELVLVHTGQHYDPLMSDVFFQELGIPAPDIHLGIGSGDRRQQTRKIIHGLLPHLAERDPDAVVVVGDVTSTAAASLAASMADVPVVHVEAGLRSFNWRMPEELNRMIADHYAQAHFVTEPTAVAHLRAEGVSPERIFLVGNVMIDTLRRIEPAARAAKAAERLGLPTRYGVLTLHRPENVDDPEVLAGLWRTMADISREIPLVFPVHPRTRQRLEGLVARGAEGIRLVDPQGYTDMLSLTADAAAVFTDSGGLQEETTVLGVPCVTLRAETERPVTVEVGTSEVVGRDPDRIRDAWRRISAGEWKRGAIPEHWDGKAAERIAEILVGLSFDA